MEVIKRMSIDLATRGVRLCVDAVQGDANTRTLTFTLTENGDSWIVPDGVYPALAYRKPDRTAGAYDTLPNGSSAVTVSANRVSVTLAPQVLSVAGKVDAALLLMDGNMNQLAAFPFTIQVAPNPAVGKPVSTDYYHYQNMEQVNAAIDGIKADVESLLAKLSAAETKITILQEQTGGLRSDVTGLQEETAVMQADIRQLIADGQAYRKSIDSLNSATDDYWYQLQDHRDRLDAMDVQLADLETAAKGIAPIIIATASGTDEAICPDSVAGRPLRRLHLYGHTYVNGTATIESPAQLTNDGDRGAIQIETGTDTVDISAPGGLAGVHTYRNESFTDENGQKWWSDSIEYKDGAATLVRRVKRLTLTGDEAFVNTYYPAIVLSLASSNYVNLDTSAGTVCNYPVKVRAGNDAGTTLAFDIDKSQFPSGDAFKSWVKERYQSGNPVVVYYGLKTPVMEQLPPMEADALAALVTRDFTVVGSDTNGYMVVDYVADTKRYIDRKFEELSKALDALIGGGA